MRAIAQKKIESFECLNKLSVSQPNGVEIEVTDFKTNTSTKYHAIKAAARDLNVDRRYIEHYIYLNQVQSVLDRYTFKLTEKEGTKVSKIQKTSLSVEVTNVQTKKVTIYSFIGAAARSLGYRQPSISLYLKENRTKTFKGLYLFKLIKDN